MTILATARKDDGTALSEPPFTRGAAGMTRRTGLPVLEVLAAAAGAGALVLATSDIVRDIAPHWDDYFLLRKRPWETVTWYVTTYGGGRPVGILINAALLWPIQRLGVEPATVVLAVRWLTLLGVYVLLRRPMGMSRAGSAIAAALFATTGPAGEGWAFYSTATQGISILATAAACGWYAHVLALVADGEDPGVRPLMLAGGLQLANVAVYEQVVLALPVLVCLIAFWLAARRGASWRDATAVGATSVGVSALWMAQLLISGYLAGRHRLSQLRGEPATNIEMGDLWWTASGAWRAFAQHHLWRAVEFVRLGPGAWFEGAGGAVAAAALVAAATGIGAAIWADRRPDAADRHTPATRLRDHLPWWMLSGSLLLAAYLAALPFGLGFPGFVDASRAYYVPAFFVALALVAAGAAAAQRRSWSLVVPAIGALVVLWCGAAARRYLMEARAGARLTREVAAVYAALPDTTRAGGVLLIAPDVIGTFSVAGFPFPESAREALSWRYPVSVGPLYATYDCGTALRGAIRDEHRRPAARPSWSAVLVVPDSGVPRVVPTVEQACTDRS